MEDTPVLKTEVRRLGDMNMMSFVVDFGTGEISFFPLDGLR